MSAWDNVQALFHACESLQGAEGCRPYLADGATFEAQSEPLTDIKTIETYADWFKGIGTTALTGVTYQLNSAAFDVERNKATFFGTVTATHSGEGGPVPPTGRTTHSHYVYVMDVNAEGKVAHMVKIWNAPWALRELGWV